ncbi:MAG: Hsp70 family protein [Magnetococcales bacterium]|nr:Hsp70 family protein [Magnetococcales bacterium]
MNDIIVGIDLGTTNSEVAIFENGQTRVLTDQQGERILPSFVGITDAGALLVGRPALNQYVANPERTIKSIKRRMGEATRISLGKNSYSPSEISAMILRQLRDTAEAALGQPVRKAVITVPAYFSDAQRQATREAGEIAGLEVMRIINEPTAAALAYEAGHRGSRRVLVYDLGGGTFDVSVVRIEDDVVEVVSSHGNNHLGGDDFDQKIVAHLLDHLKQQGVQVPTTSSAMARIIRCAEAAKRQLSDHVEVQIDEEYLLEYKGRPVHLSLELSRRDYEEMIQPYIDETMAAVHTALNGANMTVAAIDEILLVGGSTRTPMVRERLQEVFGLIPRGEIDPDLCVAMGAAIHAGVMGGSKAAAVLVDVTPYTFGIGVVGMLDGDIRPGVLSPIIRKNTSVPVSRSEIYMTMIDGQERVGIDVYQGEHPDVSYDVQIGSFTVEGLSDVPAGNEIVVQFDLNLDGMLQVTAREKSTGLAKQVTIDNAMTQQEGGKRDVSQSRDQVAALFGQSNKRGTEDNRADSGGSAGTPPRIEVQFETDSVAQQAAALVTKARRLLDQATEADRIEIVDLIDAIQSLLEKGDTDSAALQKPCDQLADILFYLET